MESENSHHSRHLPSLIFENQKEVFRRLRSSPFYDKIEKFFEVRSINNYSEIRLNDGVSPAEFSSPKDVPSSHIYNKIFEHIAKEEGQVRPVSFLVTFDQRIFDIDDGDEKECEKTGIIYEFITLGESPVIYYFYLSPQYVIDIARNIH